MPRNQQAYNIRFEWGRHGIDNLGPSSEAIILVDILSFTTCVDIALAREAIIYPCAWNNKKAKAFAQSKQAILASKRSKAVDNAYSLSPASLMSIPRKTRLVLPSPNGSTLTLQASKYCTTYAACLRNGQAVADYVQSKYKKIAIIACGERWPDGSLRPAIEDSLGAGAVMNSLKGLKSPEARYVEHAYQSHKKDIMNLMMSCTSGVELCEQGYKQDVLYAAEENVSDCIPQYADEYYTNISS